ncbi:MAG: hypothetical protein KIT14_20265 [bacterium]|nr:hypothetical protein [bacterium]
MIVRRPRVTLDADRARLAVRVESESAAFATRDLHLAVPRAQADWLDASGTPWLPMLLLLAGTLRERLVLEAPVSPRLLAAAPDVARQCGAWWDLGAARVEADAAAPDGAPTGTETLCCFTRGVDSWYAAERLARDGEAATRTHLLYVPDFDRHYTPPRRREAVRRTREAAARLGLPLIVVLEHDLRELLDPFVIWDFTHGGALAGTALALGNAVATFVIPGTHDHAHRPAHGSHPDLDPRWSTERTTVVYDAADVPRTAKVQAVAASPIALPRLKVCWEADVDDNCGRCRKCLRTMLALAFAGRLEGAPFAAPLTLEAFGALPPPRREQRRMLFTELYDAVPDDPAWDAWREALQARLSWWHPDAPLPLPLPEGTTVRVETPPGTARTLAATAARGLLPGELVARDPTAPATHRLEVTWTAPARGSVALPWRPPAAARERLLATCRAETARPVPWCLLEPPGPGSSEVIVALTRAWGPGVVWTPHRALPGTDHGVPAAEAAAIQQRARVRAWRGDGAALDPFRVLAALAHGCLPLQCVAPDEWATLVPALPRGLDAFVLALDPDGLAPLDAAARLERGLAVILAGSLERDLHAALAALGLA